ncbi:unnamed protein product [Caenorhabditis brenneri]
MSERSKYAINGVYKCERFEQHLATGQFPELNIGYPSWTSRVYITLKVREEYNQVYPYMAFAGNQKRKIRAFLKIKSKFWSLCYQTNESIYLESDAGVSGPSIHIQDVLNDENGYLENEALTVEYGLHVDAILGYHDIWIFNLHNKLFDSEQESNTAADQYLLDHGAFEYYSPKPRLVVHSPLFGHETKEVLLQDGFHVEQCLQIANGVRLQYRSYQGYEWFNIAKVGRKLNMMNVVHYCESMIIRTSPMKTVKYLKTAIQLNMRQCSLHMIELWNFKELLEELRDDLDELPGEMLKVIIRRFFKAEF